MVMHAKSGLGRPNGDVEVMGIMQGYPLGTTLYVMDAFGLPVEGTETRVNAGAEADPAPLQAQAGEREGPGQLPARVHGRARPPHSRRRGHHR